MGTTCKRGHDMADNDNVYTNPRGRRVCRPCRRERERPASPPSAGGVMRGYARVSTRIQAEDGVSIQAQTHAIEQEAARRQAGPVLMYVDGGYSGGNLRRPEMQRLLSEVGAGDVVISTKLDRVSRSLADFAGLMERSVREGWALIILDLGLDMTTTNGRLVANILAAVAQAEREMASDRIRDGMAEIKRSGYRLGRRRSDAVDAVLEQVVRERNEGKTLQQIADGLNARGLPTAQGCRWTASTVARTIRSAELDRQAPNGRWVKTLCRSCQKRLDQGATTCQHCGRDQEEAA